MSKKKDLLQAVADLRLFANQLIENGDEIDVDVEADGHVLIDRLADIEEIVNERCL